MNAQQPTPTKQIPEDDEIWAAPMSGESNAWFSRASLYFAMGASRSVRAVYNAELAARGTPSARSRAVPGSWTQASHRYEWQRRAEAFDAWRRKEVFSSGNAQDTERIKKLDKLIDTLCQRCMAILEGMDTSEVGADQLARLITALLAAIDLMARHCGGYAPQRHEITGKDGKAIEIEETKVNVVFYVPEVAEMDDAALEDAASADALPGEQGGQGATT